MQDSFLRIFAYYFVIVRQSVLRVLIYRLYRGNVQKYIGIFQGTPMKEKIWNKKYIYIKMTVLLISIIVGILMYYTYSVQKVATEQCFSILDDSRDQLSQMIRYEMENEQGHLEAAAKLLQNLVTSYEENEPWILQIMNASNANRTYAHWELCLPDERVIQSDGTTLELGNQYSFEERIQEGFSVSERRTALKDGES